MQRTTFLLVAALMLVIIAAGIGGGVGGSAAVKKARSSCQSLSITSPTPSKPTADSVLTPPLIYNVSRLALDCPAINGQTMCRHVNLAFRLAFSLSFAALISPIPSQPRQAATVHMSKILPFL
jgi:hypothetical protein